MHRNFISLVRFPEAPGKPYFVDQGWFLAGVCFERQACIRYMDCSTIWIFWSKPKGRKPLNFRRSSVIAQCRELSFISAWPVSEWTDRGKIHLRHLFLRQAHAERRVPIANGRPVPGGTAASGVGLGAFCGRNQSTPRELGLTPYRVTSGI